MILDIRGTHGSGKSWVVRQLLDRHGHHETDEGYWVPDLNLAVVGRYNTPCGGCDGIKTADEVCRRVRALHASHNVILEGILVAHTFSRYLRLADELRPTPYVFCFLNTPLAVCLSRVRKRRLLKGNTKPLNPTNIIRDWHNIWHTVQGKLRAEGMDVEVLPYRDPLSRILELLTSSPLADG